MEGDLSHHASESLRLARALSRGFERQPSSSVGRLSATRGTAPPRSQGDVRSMFASSSLAAEALYLSGRLPFLQSDVAKRRAGQQRAPPSSEHCAASEKSAGTVADVTITATTTTPGSTIGGSAPTTPQESTAPFTSASYDSYTLLSQATTSATSASSSYVTSTPLLPKKSLKSATSRETLATSFSDLPADVLANIFSYFAEADIASRLALVCRGWRAASKQPRLWRRLEFRGKRVATSVVCRLLRTAPLLHTLRLDAVPNASTIVRQLCRCNPEVQVVTIRNCTFKKEELIPETVFRNMIVCCPKIVTLDLKGTQFSAFRFYQELIHLPKLRSLNVGANRYMKVQDLLTLALNCKGLQELKVAKRPPRVGFGPLTDSDAVYMFTHLKASLISLKFDVAGLGDATLLAIVKCTQLRKLGLLNARDFTGDRLRLLEEYLEKLVSFKLTYPCQMKPDHFRYLFSGNTSKLRNLVKLSLIACWGLQDSGLQAVVETCKENLQSLSLKCCKTLTSEGIRFVIHRCSHLRRFNVAYAIQGGVAYLEEVPQCLPSLSKLVVDTAYRKSPSMANLHFKMPTLVLAVNHSEYSSEETPLEF